MAVDMVAVLSAYLKLMAAPRPPELSLTVLHPGTEPARLPDGEVVLVWKPLEADLCELQWDIITIAAFSLQLLDSGLVIDSSQSPLVFSLAQARWHIASVCEPVGLCRMELAGGSSSQHGRRRCH